MRDLAMNEKHFREDSSSDEELKLFHKFEDEFDDEFYDTKTVYENNRHFNRKKSMNSSFLDEMENENFLDNLSDWLSGVFGGSATLPYKVSPAEQYGGKWRNTRPPGLPAYARQTGEASSALSDVRVFAERQALGDTFVKTVVQMAKTESGARYALPANNFNANPPHLRPKGKGLITAWGVFQYNRDAWTCLFSEPERLGRKSYVAKGKSGCSGCKGSGGCVFPWDCTPKEEIEKPILQWAKIYREILTVGGSAGDAAGGIRLFHISPAAKRGWLKKAGKSGFSSAWKTNKYVSRIRSFLNKAGIIRPSSIPSKEFEAAEFETEVGSWANKYPPGVREAIALGGAMWPLALRRAIDSGFRDSNTLANIAFYMNHPERNGRPIAKGEPGASGLIEAWKFFRDAAKKMLPSAPSAPSSLCGKTVPQVNVLMPTYAPGLEAKKPQSHRYGLPETIAALKEIGRRWKSAHPSDPPIRIRDISRCGGGRFRPHGSHRMGIDVDIGLMRNDGVSSGVNFKTQPRTYSRKLTQEMINTIRSNGVLKVHRLWFADRKVSNVNHDNIHNNHVHVRFCLPARYDLKKMIKAAFPGGTKGTYAKCS